MPIDSLLTTIFFLETQKPTFSTRKTMTDSEPDLAKPKLLLPNCSAEPCRHCLTFSEARPTGFEGATLTMSSRHRRLIAL